MTICRAEDVPPTDLSGVSFISAIHLAPRVDSSTPPRGDEREYDLSRTLIPVGPVAVGPYRYCDTLEDAKGLFNQDNIARAAHEEEMRKLREKERLEKLAAVAKPRPVPACVQGNVFHGIN